MSTTWVHVLENPRCPYPTITIQAQLSKICRATSRILFPSLPRATADQHKSQGRRPKKSTQQETTTPAAHQPLSLDKQIQLEQLKHSNLQLQLELTRAQLELAKISPNVKPSQAISSMKPEVLSPLDNILASTPFRPPTQEVLAEGGSVPTLKDLQTKDKKERKHLSLLPIDYLFSAKG